MIGAIVRETAGWALVVIGLWFFYQSYSLLLPGMERVPNPPAGTEGHQPKAGETILIHRSARILTAPPIALIGFFIFRGGIHLVKVSVAARVSQKAQRELTEAGRRPRLPIVGRK